AVARRAVAGAMWLRVLWAVRQGAAAGHPPDVVVGPQTAEEVAAIVRLARARRVPVVPYGAGSGVCGGALPLHGGITVDLKRMDRILAVDENDLVVEAECGINGERLERALAARGLTLGHFPSSIYCSTLGGWLAARSGGQMSTRYGKIEDMVLGVTAVTGRGDIVTTGRYGRVQAGPDWTQLLVGSEGTLAVLTSGRLRIRRAPQARHVRGFSFARIPAGLEAVRRVLQRGLRPAVVRPDAQVHSWMALRPHDKAREARPSSALPGHAPPAPKKGLLAGLLGGALDRPRALNALVELGAQKLLRPGCLLIVGVEGAEPRARVEAGVTFAELERSGGKDLGEEPGKDWLARRYAVSYNMAKIFEAGGCAGTMGGGAAGGGALEPFEGVVAAPRRHAFVMAHFSHAYPEGCSIYFTFAGHASTRAAAEAKYDALWRDGLLAATRAGGTISHHHGVGLLKGPYMAEEHRESMALFHALKETLDPDGIMNPGKLGLPSKQWTAT